MRLAVEPIDATVPLPELDGAIGIDCSTQQNNRSARCAALERLERAGYGFGARRIDILATEPRAKLGDRVAEALGALASRKLLDHAYYSGGLRYQLWVTTTDGVELPLIDGGAFDWLAKLTSSRRAVFVASGAGAQLIPLRFSVANGLPTRASGPR